MTMTLPKVCSIKASREEVSCGRLSERNLETAIRHIYHDGLVVVEDVIDHDVLDRLNHKMVQDALLLSGRRENSPFNYNKSNLQQDAPPVGQYFEPSIFLSKLLTSTIRSWSLTLEIQSRPILHQPCLDRSPNSLSALETQLCHHLT